jgi:hypothetical protein
MIASAIAALFILVALIALLGLWWKGATVIFLPGLGVVVATRLILLLCLILEVVCVILVFRSWRSI